MQNRYIIKHKSIVYPGAAAAHPVPSVTYKLRIELGKNLDIHQIQIPPPIYIIKTIFKPLYVEPYQPIEKSTR